jgi:WG containing repeat
VKLGTTILVAAAIAFPLPVIAQRYVSPKEPLVIVQNGKYGYINHSGGVVIRPQFLWGTDFEGGYGTVYVCGRLVSIDQSGHLLPLKYSNRKDRLSPRASGGKVGFVDVAGRFKISPIFPDALPFSEGLAAVQVGDSWGFIDTTGRQVIQPTFQAAYYFREGVANAEKGGENVLIDKTGTVLARGYEQLVGIVAGGRVPVSRNGKFGFLDLHGKVAIPLEYYEVSSFSEGLAPVKKGNKWGYVDGDGKVVVPFIFDHADIFASGLAPVRIAGQSGFIGHSGKFAFHLQFDYAPGFLTGDADGMLTADTDVSRFWTADRAFGYVDTSGRVVWGPIKESPDHPPLLGWSEKDKVASCEGVPENVRKIVASFPN